MRLATFVAVLALATVAVAGTVADAADPTLQREAVAGWVIEHPQLWDRLQPQYTQHTFGVAPVPGGRRDLPAPRATATDVFRLLSAGVEVVRAPVALMSNGEEGPCAGTKQPNGCFRLHVRAVFGLIGNRDPRTVATPDWCLSLHNATGGIGSMWGHSECVNSPTVSLFWPPTTEVWNGGNVRFLAEASTWARQDYIMEMLRSIQIRAAGAVYSRPQPAILSVSVAHPLSVDAGRTFHAEPSVWNVGSEPVSLAGARVRVSVEGAPAVTWTHAFAGGRLDPGQGIDLPARQVRASTRAAQYAVEATVRKEGVRARDHESSYRVDPPPLGRDELCPGGRWLATGKVKGAAGFVAGGEKWEWLAVCVEKERLKARAEALLGAAGVLAQLGGGTEFAGLIERAPRASYFEGWFSGVAAELGVNLLTAIDGSAGAFRLRWWHSDAVFNGWFGKVEVVSVLEIAKGEGKDWLQEKGRQQLEEYIRDVKPRGKLETLICEKIREKPEEGGPVSLTKKLCGLFGVSTVEQLPG